MYSAFKHVDETENKSRGSGVVYSRKESNKSEVRYENEVDKKPV